MIVKEAKAVAQQWFIEEATKLRGFAGAFSADSTNWLPDDALFPATSDVDSWVVFPETVVKTPCFFASDISEIARPVAVVDSRI